MYELEKEEGHITQEITYQHFSKRQAASLLIIVATILFNVFGIFVFDWTFNEMSANSLTCWYCCRFSKRTWIEWYI